MLPATFVMMHAGPVHRETSLTTERIVHCPLQGGLKSEQSHGQLRQAHAQDVEIPGGMAEEAMKRAVVFELGQLRGLDHVGYGTTARTQDTGAGQGPEGGKAGLSKAGLEGEQEGSKGMDQEVWHH